MTPEKHVLANGLRLITIPQPEALSVTTLVLVAAGSKYETAPIAGISHFLEHMCFKGTDQRKKPIDLSSELDSLGAAYNAFTAQEYTGYYATVAPPHFARALDLVADIYLHSTLPEPEIEREKGVIIEEINMYEDMPHHQVHDLFMELLYGDQPAGWGIAGTKETVRSFSQTDLLKYRAAHYLPQATLVVVSGRFAPDQALASVNNLFATMSKGEKADKLGVRENQSDPAFRVKTKKSDQSHVVLGVRSAGIMSADEMTLEVLATLLGGGMSSRLFVRIREEMGAAYYVRASQDSYTDHGYLAISAGVNNTLLEPAVVAMIEECKKLTTETVPEAELRRVKDSMIGHLYLGLETSSSQATFSGLQELLKHKFETAPALAAKIEAVNAQDLRRIAEEIFQNAKLNLAVVGPTSEGEATEKFGKILHF